MNPSFLSSMCNWHMTARFFSSNFSHCCAIINVRRGAANAGITAFLDVVIQAMVADGEVAFMAGHKHFTFGS